jgi:hypothetical protein
VTSRPTTAAEMRHRLDYLYVNSRSSYQMLALLRVTQGFWIPRVHTMSAVADFGI